MDWIHQAEPPRMLPRPPTRVRTTAAPVWHRCDGCNATLFAAELAAQLQVCPRCGHHGALAARQRLAAWLEPGSTADVGNALAPRDALAFTDVAAYPERLRAARAESGEAEALVAQTGVLAGSDGLRVALACFEYRFMGGSMGSVVGERFARTVDAACAERLPFICVTSSGGARMQEGLFSLLQMSKTAAAVAALRALRLPFVSVLAHPTMGGVSASFAFLADVVIAEPGALIGFAGPRVIRQTLHVELPPGFQRAEFVHAKGAADRVLDRREQLPLLCRLLKLLHRRGSLA